MELAVYSRKPIQRIVIDIESSWIVRKDTAVYAAGCLITRVGRQDAGHVLAEHQLLAYQK